MITAALVLLAAIATLGNAAADRIAVLSDKPSASFERTRWALCGLDADVVCDDVTDDGALKQRLRAGYYDFLLAEGPPAKSVADFAAVSGTPVFRVAESLDSVHPAFERPAAIVLPDVNDLPRETYGGVPRPLAVSPCVAALNATPADLARTLRAAAEGAPPPAFTCRVESESRQLEMAITHRVPADAASAPLGLTMIVRNEQDTIDRTMDTGLGALDAWTIVDTGSTDRTVQTIKRSALASTVPGTVGYSKFDNFETTRNAALKMHGAKTAYVVMPDADFGFVNLWRLRTMAWRLEAECAHWCGPVCGASMKLVRRTEGVDVDMIVVFPGHAVGTDDGWHYVYPVHEVATLGAFRGGDIIAVPPDHVRMQVLDGANPYAKSPTRWRDFDLPVLREAAAKQPNDSRIAFYLARTLQAINEDEEAIKAYQRRIDLGGWFQEVFFSHYEIGLIRAHRANDDPTEALLTAIRVDPERAEPYVALAEWHDRKTNECSGGGIAEHACKLSHRAAGYAYAKEAMSRSATLPSGKLFLLTDAYHRSAPLQLSLHAYWLADAAGDACTVGRATANMLSRRFDDRQPFKRNAAFFETLSKRLGPGLCDVNA